MGDHPGPPDDGGVLPLKPVGIEQDLKEAPPWVMDEVAADIKITCNELLDAVEANVRRCIAERKGSPPVFSGGKTCRSATAAVPPEIPSHLCGIEHPHLSGCSLGTVEMWAEPETTVMSKEPVSEASTFNARKKNAAVLDCSHNSVCETIESVILKYKQEVLQKSPPSHSRFGRVRKRRCISPSGQTPVKKSKVNNAKSQPSSVTDTPKRRLPTCSKMQRKHCPGNIVWFKVLGQPYWPGKVTCDSSTGEYVRNKAGLSEYHVTPFGKNPSHKWVLAPQVMKFQGKQQFEEHVKDLTTRYPKNSVKHNLIKGRFIMSSPKRQEWEQVVREVETSHTIDNLISVPEPLIDPSPPPLEKEKRKRKPKKAPELQTELPSSLILLNEPVTPPEFYIEKSQKKCPPLKVSLLNPAKDKKQPNNLTKAKLIGSKVRRPRKSAVNGAIGNTTLAEEARSKGQSMKKFLKESASHTGDSDSAADCCSPSKKIGDPDLTSVSSPSHYCSPVKKFGAADSRNDKVCQVCERIIAAVEVGVKCIGGCNGIFHITCANPLPALPLTGDYRCEECLSGVHKCFVCKTSEGVVRRCNIRLCGKFYHHSCITSYRHARIDGNSYICSLHICLTCAQNKLSVRGNRGRMCRCLRCPVAYHSAEDCLAAGSEIISSSAIICPIHYEPAKQLPPKKVKHVNVNWCFVCSTGGSLICCETCPASFHSECLGIEPPEGSYYCAECLLGTQLKYGDIVWAKMGAYRWWPAKIINPRNVPINIQTMPHQVGEFVVCFFGTHDYNWTFRSRVFQFLEGDQGAHGNNGNRLARLFDKALDEASVAYQEWKIAKECRAAQDYERNNLRPPHYKHIKANKPVGRVTLYTADPSQMTPCDCDPNSENPCGSDSDCLNRMLMFECHPAVCPAGGRCQNQRFEKRLYVPAEPFKAEGKGWGLKNLIDVKKGEFVNEYLGELIDEEECRRRMAKMHEEHNTNYYFLTIDKDRIIDAGRKGNLSRFMNHSCQPNCETHKWTVNGDTRVGLFAVRDVPTGTELTFNYNLDCLGNEKTTCICEAPNCSGFIGDRPKKSDKVSKLKKKKRKARTVKCAHEDECFRCGKDGELLLCDRKKCSKAYHLNCLKLDKPPHGRWDCPWHHCDICGKAASSLCAACPNSFCKEHSSNSVQLLPDGTVYCNIHMKTSVSPLTVSNAVQPNCVSPLVTPATENKVLTEEEIAILNLKKQRQRMIAEKLKIKLNGARLYSIKPPPRERKARGKYKPRMKKKKKEEKATGLKTKVTKRKSTQSPSSNCKRPRNKPVLKIKTAPLPNGKALDVHSHRHSSDKEYTLCPASKEGHQKGGARKLITLKISKVKVEKSSTAVEKGDVPKTAAFNGGVLNANGGSEVAAKVRAKKRRKPPAPSNGEVKDGAKHHPSRKVNGRLTVKTKKRRTSSFKVSSGLIGRVNNSSETPVVMIIKTEHGEGDGETAAVLKVAKSLVPDAFAHLQLPNSISSF